MNKTEMQIKTILEACEDKKGYAFNVIDISRITSFADYFIICSANNERQSEAIAEEVMKRMSDLGIHAMNKEGFNTKCDCQVKNIRPSQGRDAYLQSIQTIQEYINHPASFYV